MKELWTNHEPAYQSQRWSFGDLRFAPKPYQQPNAVVGRRRKPGRQATCRRYSAPAGIPTACRRRVPRLADEVRDMASAAGRDPDAIEMSLRLNVTGELDTKRLLETLRAYEDAGVIARLPGARVR